MDYRHKLFRVGQFSTPIDIYAGTNPCAVGGSAAGAGPGIGISFGFTTSSHECVQRAWYVLMMQSAAAAAKAGNAALAYCLQPNLG